MTLKKGTLIHVQVTVPIFVDNDEGWDEETLRDWVGNKCSEGMVEHNDGALSIGPVETLITSQEDLTVPYEPEKEVDDTEGSEEDRLSPYINPVYRLSPEAYTDWLARLRQDPSTRND